MPECVINEVKVALSEKEKKAYDTMKAEMVLSLGGEEIDAGNAAALANKLSQMANARLWRQGQKADTVVIHHIIAANTIDERIMSALRKKVKTQSALIDAVKANLEV